MMAHGLADLIERGGSAYALRGLTGLAALWQGANLLLDYLDLTHQNIGQFLDQMGAVARLLQLHNYRLYYVIIDPL